MIVIVNLDGKPVEYFKDYNALFDHLTAIENAKLLAKRPKIKQMNWSFTLYSPMRVTALYLFSQNLSEALEEAFAENLPLIEICTGDYTRPLHIALTPNVDLDYLKKKWCIDYCTWHHLVVREV